MGENTVEIWIAIARNFGFGAVVAGLCIFAMWKILLPWIKEQQREYTASLQSAIADARAERDDMRKSRDRERDLFLVSIERLTASLDNAACRYDTAYRGKSS